MFAGVLTIKQGICISYTVSISGYTPPPFTSQFKESLKRLNVAKTKDQQKEEFKKFIDEFGTHFLKQVCRLFFFFFTESV